MSGDGQHHSAEAHGLLDEAWDGAVGGLNWLKSVLIGEFEDHRPLSAMVADMLVSFVPGVVIVTSARDAVAVVLRLAQHPEKREELMEWVLLVACLIVLALPLVMAAGGAVGAGIGAVGGIAGSELGAALRAVMLLLIKEATKLIELVQFLRKFISGDIMKFLRAVRFVQFEQALVKTLGKIIGKLVGIVRKLRAALMKLPPLESIQRAIAKLTAWEQKFYGVQQAAIQKVPQALAELQLRLDKALAQALTKETHTAAVGVEAQKPAKTVVEQQRVSDVAGRSIKPEPAKPTAIHATASEGGAARPPSKPAAKPKPEAGEARSRLKSRRRTSQ